MSARHSWSARSLTAASWRGRRAAVALLAALSVGEPLGAQSVAAIARPAVRAADTLTTEFNVDGVNVILRRNTANDVIAANLFLLGGVQQLTPATQGIEPFLLAASERGTKHYSSDALRTAMNMTGSVITIEPEDDWTVESLASKVGMSRSAFAARFAQLVEEPPLTYLTRWRMQKASRLLETSPAGVAEIAKRVGYDAEAAFSKAFKRWIGVAPGAYRRTSESRSDRNLRSAGDGP